jgi:hypothetical protein
VDHVLEEILSSTRVDLPASKLPLPSYLLLSLSSESESANGANEYFSEDPADTENDEDAEMQPSTSYLRRYGTESSERRCASNEDAAEGLSVSHNDISMPEAPSSLIGAAETSDFDRTAVLYQPVGIAAGGLTATVGGGQCS